MTSSYRRLVLNPLVVLLMLVAMVFATVADAAACGAEVAPADSAAWIAADIDSAASGLDEDSDDKDTSVDQHGVCGHGHCHHGASFAPGLQEKHPLKAVEVVLPSDSVVLTSDENTRLRRPPRV